MRTSALANVKTGGYLKNTRVRGTQDGNPITLHGTEKDGIG